MSYSQTLQRPGLVAFLWTQFLRAFNDNVFKIVVSFRAMDAMGEVDGVAFVGAVFILPFLLFSGYAGHLADRHSKRQVLVWMKWLEVVAMALAEPALILGHRRAAGRAVPDGHPVHVLQPGQIRHHPRVSSFLSTNCRAPTDCSR